MITKTDIHKLIDYALLNAYSVNSTGLYNGKAGLSLCLFEVAKMLTNEFIEKHAFELLQEALLSKNEDISFENGLAGIGFTLLYLINNQFIEGDFEELFQDQFTKILADINKTDFQSDSVILLLPVVYLLHVANIRKKSNTNTEYIKKIIDCAGESLHTKFLDFDTQQKGISKFLVLNTYQTYLKVVCTCGYNHISTSLLNTYCNLYTAGKIASNFTTGYYMNLVAKQLRNNTFQHVASEEMKYALQNVYPGAMSLSQKTDLLHLLYPTKNKYSKLILQVENNITDVTGLDTEKSILQNINPQSFIAGYETGVSRLLLYLAFKNEQDKACSITRFQSLF